MHNTDKDQQTLTVAITGASGLIGKQLSALLTTGGHRVRPMVRSRSHGDDAIYWNPDDGEIDAAALEGVDAVVHLAGESIGDKRWSQAQKERIMKSREKGTRLISETLAAMPAEARPKVLVTASAIGYFGDRGEELLSEESGSGNDFLAEVCRVWEGATLPATEAGIRVVTLRFGIVLSMGGGALAKMLFPFRMGVGGILGNGKQYMSWIALDDVIDMIHFAISNDEMSGVYNAVAPDPVTNHEFTKTLGRVLRRPTLFPVPGFALRLLFGEMGDALLLSSARVSSKRIESAGYKFRYASLEDALRHVLGRMRS